MSNPVNCGTTFCSCIECVAQPKRNLVGLTDDPVAWRTFDGEGGYEYYEYEGNENYALEWERRNPNHHGWVEALYTCPLKEKNT